MKKILGIGNALTDMLLQISNDEILNHLNLPKGSMQLVDTTKQEEIYNYLRNTDRIMITGGSASNTINGLTRLGSEAGFIGKTGKDEIGEFYINDSVKNGVKPSLFSSDSLSGCSVILISPDGERTMCTFLGAAAELHEGELHAGLFSGYDIFHIEGYMVQNHELVLRAMELAKEAGLKISIDMASYNVVQENLEFLKEMVHKYVDILFANEEEAYAFTGKEPLEALDEMAESVSIAVVKIGKRGSWVKSDGVVYFVHAGEATCLDSTGAGDLYATGFLYGLACEYPLDICGKIASLVAENIVQVVGAKMEEERWECIRKEIQIITGVTVNSYQ